MIYLADWLQDIRRKLRDTAPYINSTQNITDASTIFNVTAASVGFAKVGQVIELVALSAGVPTGTLEQCLITAVTPGIIPSITVIRAYGTDQIGTFCHVGPRLVAFLVHRITAGHKYHQSARLHAVDGLGEEIIVQRKSLFGVLRIAKHFDVSAERRIAEADIIKILRQLSVDK